MTQSGWSIEGKVVVITGATSGLGRISANKIAELGARLYLICRDKEKGGMAVDEIKKASGNPNIHLLIADLSSQSGIKVVAEEFLSRESQLHLLLNNAGAIFPRVREESEDGIEKTFALNHLSYFSLTLHLLDIILASAPSRIVNVASDGYTMGGGQFRFDDYEGKNDYSFIRQYGQSKLANILFTQELARRLEGKNVTVNSASPPGLTATKFGYGVHPLMKLGLFLARPFVNSAEKGAESQLFLCTSPALNNVSGRHFTGTRQDELLPYARDESDAYKLWELSENITGIRWRN